LTACSSAHEAVICSTLELLQTAWVTQTSCDTDAVAHIRLVTRVVDCSDKANRQMFREVADKHTVQQPQSEFVHMVSTVFDHVCDSAINAKILPRCKRLMQGHSSSGVMPSFKHASSKE